MRGRPEAYRALQNAAMSRIRSDEAQSPPSVDFICSSRHPVTLEPIYTVRLTSHAVGILIEAMANA